MTSFARPRRITPSDDVSAFSCGKPPLDNWLYNRAIRNESDGNSRTYVCIERESALIAGFYCLSSHSVAHEDVDGKLRRNAPDPIPVLLVGRLATDLRFQGQGVGASLIQDAISKVIATADVIGTRAVLVHAIDDEAVGFYLKFGFTLVRGAQRILYLRTIDALATMEALSGLDSA